jgi:hypothetical protein
MRYFAMCTCCDVLPCHRPKSNKSETEPKQTSPLKKNFLIGSVVLNATLIVQETIARINKWGCIKLKIFCIIKTQLAE